MGNKVDWSIFGSPGPGLHLTINPQKSPKVKRTVSGEAKLPPNKNLGEIYKTHGLRLTDKELSALKVSRTLGVKAIDEMLSHVIPANAGVNPVDRLNLAMKAADLLMEKSLEAQLSREVPTALNREEQTAEKLDFILRNMGDGAGKKGPAPSLIQQIPLGVSITVHMPTDWL
jgi:hypothetical protein